MSPLRMTSSAQSVSSVVQVISRKIPDAPVPGNAACYHCGDKIAAVIERLILPICAEPALAGQAQRNPGDERPDKRRADAGDHL